MNEKIVFKPTTRGHIRVDVNNWIEGAYLEVSSGNVVRQILALLLRVKFRGGDNLKQKSKNIQWKMSQVQFFSLKLGLQIIRCVFFKKNLKLHLKAKAITQLHLKI